MARSPLFRQLQTLLRLAIANERQQLDAPQIQDAVAMRREGHDWTTIAAACSRRQLVREVGAGLVTVAAGRLLSASSASAWAASPPQAALNHSGRVVVVGAGLAGLTTSYRLLRRGVPSVIYEAAERLGGRLFTQYQFNDDGMFCERGGELVDSQHLDVITLCRELGIGIQELRSEAAGATSERYFIRGQHRREEEVIAAFQPLAKVLAADLKLLSPAGEVIVPTYNSALAKLPAVQALDRQSLAEYLDKVSIDAWLRELISVAYTGEYGREPSEQSALNLLTLIGSDTSNGFKMFGASDESKRIEGGSSALPRALAAALHQQVPINTGHRLVAVIDEHTRFTLVFDRHGASVEVPADQIVLALPIALLREVDFTRARLSSVKERAIKEWGVGTNAKLMLGFKERTWRSAAAPGGFVCYSDTSSQEFWETSRAQKGRRGIVTAFTGGRGGVRPTTTAQALANLNLIFPGVAAAHDGKAVLHQWLNAPFAKGSYTCSLPGQFTTIYGAPGEPELNGRLVFAGEHCSTDWSGFINGAVQSGNQAAALVSAKAAAGIRR